MPDVRAWSGMIEPAFQKDIIESVKSEPPGMFSRTADDSSAYQALAVSGGGENGAFSAGFLNGWTKSGHRPTFKIVTGISTGATGDLYRIYTLIQRGNVKFNFVGIPDDYEWTNDEEFDPQEMKGLYDLGYELALSDNPWLKTLPGFSP